MLYAFDAPGRALIVAIVALTSITSMNAILIAGARTTHAAARDTAGLDRLGRWHVARGTPSAAIVATAGLALALVGLGAYTRGGFATMVDYLSPVYWLFMTMSGVALLVLRRRYPHAPRPFRVVALPLRLLPRGFGVATGRFGGLPFGFGRAALRLIPIGSSSGRIRTTLLSGHGSNLTGTVIRIHASGLTSRRSSRGAGTRRHMNLNRSLVREVPT